MNPERIIDDEKTSATTTIKRKRNLNDSHNIVTSTQHDNDDDKLLLESLINPNFEELSRQFLEFRIAYQHIIQLQKNDKTQRGPIQSYITQEFTIALTKALLHVYFHGITLYNIPNNHLCPPIPNRYYFVQWIRNTLLPLTKRHHNNYDNDHDDQYSLYFDNKCGNNEKGDIDLLHPSKKTYGQTIYGLDIGTGATCIYPILMVASSIMYGNHDHNNEHNDIIQVYATDIDLDSIQCANENVSCNVRLRNHIHLIHVPPSESQQLFLSSTTATNQTISNASNHPNNDPNQCLLLQSSSTSSSSFPFRIGPLRRSLESCFHDKNNKNSDVMIGENDDNDNHGDYYLDFCMTNPPFYNLCDPNEVVDHNQLQRRSGDGRQRTNMTLSESFYPDGEIGFMIDILFDALYLFFIKNNSNNNHYNPQQSSSSSTNEEILLSSLLADQQQKQHLSSTMNRLQLPIPFWICYMIGTKSSFIIIKHIIEQLLGYSHIHITEFGPGKLTRWFIAYTLEKPNIRSPLAKIIDTIPWKLTIQYSSLSSSFSTLLENSNHSLYHNTTMFHDDNYSNNIRNDKFISFCLSDIIDRMKEYCHDFPNHQLFVTVDDDEKASTRLESSSQKNIEHNHKQIIHLTIQECVDDDNTSLYHTNMWPGDDELPQRFQQILQQKFLSSKDRMNFFIPKEGHFILDVTLTCDIVMPSSKHDNTTNGLPLSSTNHDDIVVEVHVQITSYRHTLYGMKIIQKIKSQFEGEICRTNRRWRRKLAHEKDDQHQQQVINYSSTAQNQGMSKELQTMDES